jgi:hypothetical protein
MPDSDLENIENILNEIDYKNEDNDNDNDNSLTKPRKKKERNISEDIKEAVEKPITRDKKPRSESQLKAFEKARAMRNENLKQKRLVREQQNKKKQDEDEIINKVKNAKKQQVSDYSDSSVSESESSVEYVPAKKSKKKKKVVIVEKPKKKKKSVKVYLSSSSDSEEESESEDEYVAPKKLSKTRVKRNVDTVIDEDTNTSEAKIDYRN